MISAPTGSGELARQMLEVTRMLVGMARVAIRFFACTRGQSGTALLCAGCVTIATVVVAGRQVNLGLDKAGRYLRCEVEAASGSSVGPCDAKTKRLAIAEHRRQKARADEEARAREAALEAMSAEWDEAQWRQRDETIEGLNACANFIGAAFGATMPGAEPLFNKLRGEENTTTTYVFAAASVAPTGKLPLDDIFSAARTKLSQWLSGLRFGLPARAELGAIARGTEKVVENQRLGTCSAAAWLNADAARAAGFKDVRIATYVNFGTGDRHAVAEVLMNGKWQVLNWGRVAPISKVDDVMRLRGFQLEGMLDPLEFRKWHLREWGGFLVPDGKGGVIPLKMGTP